jgi:hypothetical protein
MDELLNVAFVIFGGFIGSALVTLFPYFMTKSKREEDLDAIRNKPEANRTPEETYMLNNKLPGFFEEYKYRFTFGLVSGIGLSLAFIQANEGVVTTYTTGQAIFAGLTASGFMSALADKIRAK